MLVCPIPTSALPGNNHPYYFKYTPKEHRECPKNIKKTLEKIIFLDPRMEVRKPITTGIIIFGKDITEKSQLY